MAMMGPIGFADVLAAQSYGRASFPVGPREPSRGPGPLSSLRAYGDVSEAVKHFQRIYNAAQPEIEAATATSHYYPLGRPDGIWGDNTDYASWGYAEWKTETTDCMGGRLVTDVRTGGPIRMKACLVADGMTDAEVDELQRAWSDYKSRREHEPPVPDGGLPPPEEGAPPPTPPAAEEESSVWPWVLGGAGVLLLGLIIWKSKKR